MQPGDPRLSRRPAPLPRAQAPRACRGRRPDLPRRGLAPSPRWAPLGRSGCSARASRDCPEGGWRGGRAAAAGRGPLYGAGGRWEGGAGESGPPHSCARRAPVGAGAGAPPPRARPPEKAAAPSAPSPCAPTDGGGGGGGASPISPGRPRAPRLPTPPGCGVGCPVPPAGGVASWLPTHLRTQGGEQPRCPDGHRPCARGFRPVPVPARAQGCLSPICHSLGPFGLTRLHVCLEGDPSKDCFPECPQARHLNLLDV